MRWPKLKYNVKIGILMSVPDGDLQVKIQWTNDSISEAVHVAKVSPAAKSDWIAAVERWNTTAQVSVISCSFHTTLVSPL